MACCILIASLLGGIVAIKARCFGLSGRSSAPLEWRLEAEASNE